MAYGNEADEIRGLAMLLKKGYIFRGLKPVNWCFDCGSALAEAEVEYEDRKDPAGRRRLRFRRAGKSSRRPSACARCLTSRAGLSSGPPRRGPCRPTRPSTSTPRSITRSWTPTGDC
jgi:hypothetical protein